MKPDDNWVRVAKCRFCGGESNALLLHKRMREIKEEEAYDPEPCDKCKERFKTHKFFIGDCGHSGFIKSNVLEKANPEAYKSVKKSKIFRMKKCFVCLGLIKFKDCKKI